MIPFAEFAPDRAAIDPSASDTIKNVLPKAGSYGPMPDFAAYSSAVSARPIGAFVARQSTGALHTFVGTATALYKLTTADLTWENVSSGTYSCATDEGWSFTQFGDFVIATNDDDPAQVYQLGVSTDFANLGGSPPQAQFASVLGDFVILANHAGADMKLQWSGLNDHAYWTVGKRSSDFQQFPDGGPIMGIVGSERGGVVFQEDVIRSLDAAWGSPEIFRISKVSENRGAVSPRSIVKSGSNIFFLAKDGFYQFPNSPIGNETVDRFFVADCDPAYLYLVQGADDPINKIVYWRYKSRAHNSTTTTDKIIGYHYGLSKWFLIEKELTWLLSAVSPGYTLETLDNLGLTLDTLPFSLDSRVYTAGAPVLAGFDTSFKLGFFSGANLEATLETADSELNPGGRALVTAVRPVVDTTTAYCNVATRATHGASRVWKTEAIVNGNGYSPARASGRLHRARLRIPAGTSWVHAHGVDFDAVPQGFQ